MLKKVLATSSVALSLMMSGCGNNSESTCRMDVQLSIDKGNYTQAIDALNGSCSSAFTQSDKNYNLATAYMGKAGLSASDVLKIIMDADNTSGSGNDNTFSTFISSFNDNKSKNATVYLQDAQDFYLKSIAHDGKDTINTLCTQSDLNSSESTRLSSACLYLGFNQTLQTVNTITLLTGDVGTLVSSIDNNSSTVPLDMQASLDALSWATSTNSVPNSFTVTASNITINENNVTALSLVSPSGEIFYRLAQNDVRGSKNSTILTDGYCDVNGSKDNCKGIEKNDGSIDTTNFAAASCYACPVDFGNNSTQNVAELLVSTLNGGTDAIANVSNDPDIMDSVNSFKTDLGVSADANVTVQDILDYLNK